MLVWLVSKTSTSFCLHVVILICYRVNEEIGSGQFGTVYKGVWLSGEGEVEVAVKTLKKGSGKEDRVKFLQEAAIMGQFKHPNVVEMYGMITTSEPVSTCQCMASPYVSHVLS